MKPPTPAKATQSTSNPPHRGVNPPRRWSPAAEIDGVAVWIGTSGWNYPHWANGVFYPHGLPVRDWLAFYATRFSAVEINSTFYRLPSSAVLRRWHDDTPPPFRFTAKASRFITHMKKLVDPKIHAGRFLERISELNDKLAAVLFQFPPFWKFDRSRLIEFTLYLSRQNLTPGLRFAMEFRNPSWLVPDAFQILRDHQIALVHADTRGLSISRTATSDFHYLRRHGPPDPSRCTYAPLELNADARWIRSQSIAGRDVFCFFNNDAEGAAPLNAAQLIQKIQIKKLPQ